MDYLFTFNCFNKLVLNWLDAIMDIIKIIIHRCLKSFLDAIQFDLNYNSAYNNSIMLAINLNYHHSNDYD
jgi:hypothetical protein